METTSAANDAVKHPADSLLFCPLCFATSEDGSGGGTALVAYCLNCGAGNSTVTLPRWAVESVRKQASWVGKRHYPNEEDHEFRAELRALRGTVRDFPGRSARRLDAGMSLRQWWVTQELSHKKTASVYVDAGSEVEALEVARYLLPFVPRPLEDAPAVTTTIFECRCCGNGVRGKTDGSFDEPGWSCISNIDGPNSICPECRADPSALDGLRADGYENARVIETTSTNV